MNFSYKNFDPNIFITIQSQYGEKIDRLSKQEKMELGSQLSRAEKKGFTQFVQSVFSNISNQQREDYLLSLAEKYIEFRLRASASNLPETSQTVNELSPSRENSEAHVQKETSNDFIKKALEINIMELLFELNISAGDSVNIIGGEFSMSEGEFIRSGINNSKKKLLTEHFPIDKAAAISAQSQRYPAMQAALEPIREKLREWNDLALKDDPSDLETLKNDLKQQIKNFVALSDLIFQETADRENASAFMSISPESVMVEDMQSSPTQEKFGQFMRSAITGKIDLSNTEAKEFFAAKLKSNIAQKRIEMPAQRSPEQLKVMRDLNPVTLQAIKQQAELHDAIRKAKRRAAEMASLVKQGKSANEVYKLESPTTPPNYFAAFEEKPGEAAAFFKIGAGGEEAAGVMEKLMWDIAVVMGMEEQFVPTGETHIRDSSHLKGGTEKIVQWNEKGQIEMNKEAQPARRGGIQVAQQGEVLSKYNQHPGSKTALLTKSEISKGILASVVFGMFDAHSTNIFITKEGKIKFFDNTRSLPNSNGFINRGNGLVSSYRCSLLNLPEAREMLTHQEIEKLKRDLVGYDKKIGKLADYLNSPQAKVQLKKLPPGWMDVEACIEAMQERITCMQEALNSNRIDNLEELIEASNPAYRFAFALSYLNRLHKDEADITATPDEVLRSDHSYVGYSQSDKDLTDLMNAGYDIAKIKMWCDQTVNTMEDIIDDLQSICNNQKIKQFGGNATLPPKKIQLANNIKEEMIKNAALDLKDWQRGISEVRTFEYNRGILKGLGVNSIDIPQATLSKAMTEAAKSQADLLLVKDGETTSLLYRTLEGYSIKEIDLKAAPGKVKVEGNLLEIKEYIANLKKEGTPPASASASASEGSGEIEYI